MWNISPTMNDIKVVLGGRGNHILGLIILYNVLQVIKYKVIGDELYNFNVQPYLFLEYIHVVHTCLLQYYNAFGGTIFNIIPAIVINGALIHILSCKGFPVNVKCKIVEFFHHKLLPFNLSSRFKIANSIISQIGCDKWGQIPYSIKQCIYV